MDDTIKPITADDLKRGLLLGNVRLVAVDGVACSIGDKDYYFYFGGIGAEETTPWQYVNDMDFDEILRDIVDTLAGFRTEFPDEWLYYRYVLNND